MDEGKMDIKIQQDPAMAQWIAKCFASMVAESPNYTEMKFDLCGQYRGKFEWMTVHIQKGNCKTPHQMRQEVERERDELRARHRTLLHEAMEMSDELAWAKQTISDALRERDAERTRAKDYFEALELAAKERDELASRLARLPNE